MPKSQASQEPVGEHAYPSENLLATQTQIQRDHHHHQLFGHRLRFDLRTSSCPGSREIDLARVWCTAIGTCLNPRQDGHLVGAGYGVDGKDLLLAGLAEAGDVFQVHAVHGFAGHHCILGLKQVGRRRDWGRRHRQVVSPQLAGGTACLAVLTLTLAVVVTSILAVIVIRFLLVAARCLKSQIPDTFLILGAQ